MYPNGLPLHVSALSASFGEVVSPLRRHPSLSGSFSERPVIPHDPLEAWHLSALSESEPCGHQPPELRACVTHSLVGACPAGLSARVPAHLLRLV